ncbi:AraC family transcriptional regulator [Mucilaginibacter sp. cycad4]|uniref:helix-turn-helix domain-containing protein n=1 Tax=Mucilaginibacter sp. cycad4 TaxID=3342096 RepID=UPI002AAA632F|nr:AraC family transcriptional regulator [Mucilaginibacter gossypii]WPV01488.1 AraC family transcriptional regulator [Mucilaginibacter gossypii]
MIKRNLKHTFSLLNVDYVKLNAKWNYRNVISPYYRIYYIDDGEGEISDAASILKLEPGYLYIIPSFTLCNLGCRDYLGQYFVQFFEDSTDGSSLFANNRAVLKTKATEMDIYLFNRLLQINPGRGINRSDNPKVYEKDIYYKEYQELNNQQNTSMYMETQGILMMLTAKFLTPQLFKHPEHKLIPVKIAETLNYILVNLHMDLSVHLLASRANQNVDYFSRQFKQYTGTRPLNYINEKRVERAQYLMATSRMSYSEICTQTGFDNLSYFSKTFKKLTGMSPSEYKKQMYQVGFNH